MYLSSLFLKRVSSFLKVFASTCLNVHAEKGKTTHLTNTSASEILNIVFFPENTQF